MKTTIEISDELLRRVRRLAQEEKTSLRSLTEQGLRLVLREKRQKAQKLPPLVTVRGEGLAEAFKKVRWSKIREEIYKGHG
jgi:predicted transcriptional regulator